MTPNPPDRLAGTVLTLADDDDNLVAEAKYLVLAALESDQLLSEALAGEYVPPPHQPASGPPPEPVGAFLKSISVSGFRGVGATASLDLHPAAGLTVVAGRNGSGKSTFAEALEVTLTSTSYRWRERSAGWQRNWANLHSPRPREIRVEIAEEGVGTTTVGVDWPDETERFDDLRHWVQRPGLKREPGAASLGWAEAIELYRPLLSYEEMGTLLTSAPSKLYDTLLGILGLERVTDAQRRLDAQRSSADEPAKIAKSAGAALKRVLADHPDERAGEVLRLIRKHAVDLDAVRNLATGSAPIATAVVARLRGLADMELPGHADAEDVATRLDGAVEDLSDRADVATTQAARRIELLRQAVEMHDEHGADLQCPVCGEGTLTGPWRTAAGAELDGAAEEPARSVRPVRSSWPGEVQLPACSPPSRRSYPRQVWLWRRSPARRPHGQPGWPHRRATPHWPSTCAGTSASSGRRSPPCGRRPRSRGRSGRTPGPRSPRRSLPGSAWRSEHRQPHRRRPCSARLARGFGTAPSSSATSSSRPWPTAPATSGQHCARRATSISRPSRCPRRRERPPGRDLGRRRRCRCRRVGGDEHRRTARARARLVHPARHPAREPVPVHRARRPGPGHGPSKIDGFVTVLAELAATRQVVVFSHDDRLPEAVRRLAGNARIIEVTRTAGSLVTLDDACDPARRDIDDARALVCDPKAELPVVRAVVPRLCRSAVETAARDRFFARSFAAGCERHDVESAWGAVRNQPHRSRWPSTATPGRSTDGSTRGRTAAQRWRYAGPAPTVDSPGTSGPSRVPSTMSRSWWPTARRAPRERPRRARPGRSGPRRPGRRMRSARGPADAGRRTARPSRVGGGRADIARRARRRTAPGEHALPADRAARTGPT